MILHHPQRCEKQRALELLFPRIFFCERKINNAHSRKTDFVRAFAPMKLQTDAKAFHSTFCIMWSHDRTCTYLAIMLIEKTYLTVAYQWILTIPKIDQIIGRSHESQIPPSFCTQMTWILDSKAQYDRTTGQPRKSNLCLDDWNALYFQLVFDFQWKNL